MLNAAAAAPITGSAWMAAGKKRLGAWFLFSPEKTGFWLSHVAAGGDDDLTAVGFGGVLRRLFLREPPTGTLRKVPPSVQWRLQPLQKWRGWDLL
nr:Armadillo-type fold [Ipomoea trifida]